MRFLVTCFFVVIVGGGIHQVIHDVAKVNILCADVGKLAYYRDAVVRITGVGLYHLALLFFVVCT